ncbi:unnamed protein product [Rotaria socialis]|uniref:Uncharacterized protein n=1 Tax=Rotaria socialis TaxID=392032 RepID=A0A821S5F1_9BILA|nr:unnamed protein product [Rotaria socialis]
MAEAAAPFFAEVAGKDESSVERDEIAAGVEFDGASTTATIPGNKMKMKHVHQKVVFNDGTAAGVLSNLMGRTRTMHLHEADVTLKSLGLLLPSPIDMMPYRVDPFRSTLMTLHEKPDNFLRILKKETIYVTGSKLNIFGASTGDFIAAELARQAASMAADALFERFILWSIDGEPIPNENCVESVDFLQYPSIQQFGVLCGFFKDLKLDLEPEGKAILAEQSFNFRVAGSQEGVLDNVSARLNKSALVSYRITGLCALIEAAFNMIAQYVAEYVTFGTGVADEEFFHRAFKIAEKKYGLYIRKEQRLMIDTDICKRAHDVTVQNVAQYMALMKLNAEDRKNWFTLTNRLAKTTVRHIAGEENIEVTDSKNNNVSLNNGQITGLPLTRKQQNMLRKGDSYKASILLHNSLVFIKSGLYVNSSLKKASSILEKNFLKPLVHNGLLIAVADGLICRRTKATVYIKMIPCNDDDNVSFHSAGVISEEVLDILRLERYQILNIDISSVFQRHVLANPHVASSRTCSISAQEKDPSCSQNITSSDDDHTNDPEQHEDNVEHLSSNILDLLHNFSEVSNDSLSIVSQLVVSHEEIIEEQCETQDDESTNMSNSHDAKRKTTNDTESSENERFSETISERIRTRQRKRVKATSK